MDTVFLGGVSQVYKPGYRQKNPVGLIRYGYTDRGTVASATGGTVALLYNNIRGFSEPATPAPPGSRPVQKGTTEQHQ